MIHNTEETEHWIFKKHTNNINLLAELALYLKTNKSAISKKEKEKMYQIFNESNIYNPRKSIRHKPLDAINHKLDALKYFMFGYSDRIDGAIKFIFSPLGNIFLKYLNHKDSLSKIFSTMLVGMQFPHPFSKKSENFLLYPFRLIFSLLLDTRLNGKLYNYEVVTFVIFVSKVTTESYENLIEAIIKSRQKTDKQKLEEIKENESKITKSVYEWQYYITPMLEDVNIINKYNGDSYIDISHPQKSNSKSAPTKRKANNGYISLNNNIKPYIEKLLQSYSIYDEPLSLKASNRKSDDIIKDIYSFYPKELLRELNETSNSFEFEVLELPKLIEEYSKNPNNATADKFENVLEEAFNMFINVDAKKISGAGNTDIECMYMTINEKFAVEAKSTANKLISINSGRLRRHRDLIGAEYTIVVTPKYVPSVRYDIQDQNIVIIKANTLAEYFYNNIIFQNRYIDYEEIQTIIINNLGQDITSCISNLTLSNFG